MIIVNFERIIMSLDLLACMQGFAAIAKYRGFTQAARHLRISHRH